MFYFLEKFGDKVIIKNSNLFYRDKNKKDNFIKDKKIIFFI